MIWAVNGSYEEYSSRDLLLEPIIGVKKYFYRSGHFKRFSISFMPGHEVSLAKARGPQQQ